MYFLWTAFNSVAFLNVQYGRIDDVSFAKFVDMIVAMDIL